MRCLRVVISLVLVCAACEAAWSQAVTLVSRGSPEGRTPIAVPPFGSSPGNEALGQQLAAILAADLQFTGLFSVLGPEAYPREFKGFGPDAASIDFDAWRKTAAEDLVYGYVTVEGQQIVAECRLFDILTVRPVLGQRLRVDLRAPRRLPHKFADEIVLSLTGVPGVASTRICLSGKVSGAKEIYLADYDGANAKRLTEFGAITIQPHFSPDGAKIVFLSYKDRYPFLYILDVATGQTRPFSKQVGLNAAPAWSPDGNVLALVLSKDANPEIYLQNADGAQLRRVTNNKWVDMSPTFDPSGRKIAFVSDQAGAEQICVMGIDGTNPQRLSFQGGRAYDPAWSPDGKYIAYVVDKAGDGLEIYAMDADGKNPRRLTDSHGGNESPSWSPDSRHLMFASTRSGQSELWTVTLETGDERRVPNLEMSCYSPSWGPRLP